jgi:thiamine kinase-like enzyme
VFNKKPIGRYNFIYNYLEVNNMSALTDREEVIGQVLTHYDLGQLLTYTRIGTGLIDHHFHVITTEGEFYFREHCTSNKGRDPDWEKRLEWEVSFASELERICGITPKIEFANDGQLLVSENQTYYMLRKWFKAEKYYGSSRTEEDKKIRAAGIAIGNLLKYGKEFNLKGKSWIETPSTKLTWIKDNISLLTGKETSILRLQDKTNELLKLCNQLLSHLDDISIYDKLYHKDDIIPVHGDLGPWNFYFQPEENNYRTIIVDFGSAHYNLPAAELCNAAINFAYVENNWSKNNLDQLVSGISETTQLPMIPNGFLHRYMLLQQLEWSTYLLKQLLGSDPTKNCQLACVGEKWHQPTNSYEEKLEESIKGLNSIIINKETTDQIEKYLNTYTA